MIFRKAEAEHKMSKKIVVEVVDSLSKFEPTAVRCSTVTKKIAFPIILTLQTPGIFRGWKKYLFS